MKRKQALLLYLAGTLGQILLVSLLVWLLRAGGVRGDYGTPIGLFTLMLGGLSSAIWGAIISIRYYHSSFKQLVRDFFQVKQAPLNYLLVLIFIGLDFLPQVFSGEMIIPTWYFPIILFVKALVFGGIEEIGWRYFFQPALQEKLTYLVSTLCTFGHDSFIAFLARLIKQLFHLIRYLYKDQKPLALCDDTCVD